MTSTDPAPDSFADLPMQPTGSGVADLAVAYEAMKVAEGSDADLPVVDDSGATRRDLDALDSEAHPS